MVIDSTKYSGMCSCGREHVMVTRAAVIEAGCLAEFEKYMAEYGICGKRCALYDENTYRAAEGRRPAAEQEIILPTDNLHADEIAVAKVLEKLENDVKVIIAVGSGTVHDVARYSAYEKGSRFVSVPTAASVDGFCSTVAAMTWHGFKKTLPAVAPEIVIADTDIIKNAPVALVKSGVGDILAKYTALADWEIAHAVTGEYLCPRIYDIMRQAVDMVVESADGLLAGEAAAYENVTYALIMSGIAMQMMGNSRPASGSEHHISHLIEMQPKALPKAPSALHGEKTGVGSLLASREYHRLTGLENIEPYVAPYEPVSQEKLQDFFGGRLAEQIAKENEDDCLCGVSKKQIEDSWEKIREIVKKIPSEESLYALLEKIEAKRSLEDIGVDSHYLPQLLEYSPLVRNRFTLMRMRRMLSAG